jgi:RimJ/RimL family protein N-acetyltransferase
VGRLIDFACGLTADKRIRRRPPAWRRFEPLDIACAAALGIEPERLGPDLLLVEGTRGSVIPGGAPCPLVVTATFRGVAIRVYDPLRPQIEELVREGIAQGGALSKANRQRLIDAVAARLPVVEVWHDLLHYTDRQRFVPWSNHKVRRLRAAPTRARRDAEAEGESPYAGAWGIYAKGEPRKRGPNRLAAYADFVVRGDYACSVGCFTEAEFRGKGMARSAVSAATRVILRAGRIPLYAADETNLSSLAVCRSLGYVKFGEGLHCFMASEQERARRERTERQAEHRAGDYAIRRWIID